MSKFTTMVTQVFADWICLRSVCPNAYICTSMYHTTSSVIPCWKYCSCWTVLTIDSDTVSYLCKYLYPSGRQALGAEPRASFQEQLQTWHGTVHLFIQHLKLWKYGLHLIVHKGKWRTQFSTSYFVHFRGLFMLTAHLCNL